MINRAIIKNIEQWQDSDEIIIIFGARQVGKTTLINLLFENRKDCLVLNCEQLYIKQILESQDLEQIKLVFGNHKMIALDEAQTITNIGKVLKLIYDELGNSYKLIVTGSSSFDLSNKVIEPLTGRNIKFKLYPLSVSEINAEKGWLWVNSNLNNLLVYGSYPGLINLPIEKKRKKLIELTSDYLFKDILMLENLKNSDILLKLLVSVALQIGSQVSLNELAKQLKISQATAEKYLDLLEKAFVIFKLPSFSSNLRNELKKSRKYYFYDVGIRNALINNFLPIENRTDKGMLWENFCAAELMKINNQNYPSNFYFWRTYDGAEIDLVTEKDNKLIAYEFKYSGNKKVKLPQSFADKYGVNDLEIITPETFHKYLLEK